MSCRDSDALLVVHGKSFFYDSQSGALRFLPFALFYWLELITQAIRPGARPALRSPQAPSVSPCGVVTSPR